MARSDDEDPDFGVRPRRASAVGVRSSQRATARKSYNTVWNFDEEFLPDRTSSPDPEPEVEALPDNAPSLDLASSDPAGPTPAAPQRTSHSPNRSPTRKSGGGSSRARSSGSRRRSRTNRRFSAAPVAEVAAGTQGDATDVIVDDRPLEERSYEELFPDLDVTASLPFIRTVSGHVQDQLPTASADSAASGLTLAGLVAPAPEENVDISSHDAVATGSLTPEISDLDRVGTEPNGPSDEKGSTATSLMHSPQSVMKGDRVHSSSSISLAITDGPEQVAGDVTPEEAPIPRPLPAVPPLLEIAPIKANFTKPVPRPSFRVQEQSALLDDEPTPGMERVAFSRPDHYVRFVEPTEDQLAKRVEYDMDEQDLRWLQIINEERKEAGETSVSEIAFEIIMDRLEKEWFEIAKTFPKPVRDESGAEDSACAICDDGECENSNAIVFCDGCNLAVHQDCYGVPYIPEGQWLCRKCMLSPETPVSCIFCPNEGGAFKQTNTSRWGHVICAQWIPEAHFANPVYMEPIDSIEMIPESRWRLQCYICRRKTGACIQCSSKNCYAAYHVTCARKVKLYMKMKINTSTADEISMRSFCDKHAPKEYRESVDMEAEINAFRDLVAELKPVKKGRGSNAHMLANGDGSSKKRKRSNGKIRNTIESDSETDLEEIALLNSVSKAARAHLHQHSASAASRFVIPNPIVRKIISELKVPIRQKNYFVEMVCRFWSLKREARRGAPLLKRLHLEPWTASASATKEDEAFRAKKNEILRVVRNDLERVRLLAELVKKREKDKMKMYNTQVTYLNLIINPATHILRPYLEDITRLDSKAFFAEPVNANEVPDYATVVNKPMDFFTMKTKLEAHEYRSFETWEEDLTLICDNALLYNAPNTIWSRAAGRLKERMQPIIASAREHFARFHIDPTTGCLIVTPDQEIFDFGAGIVKAQEEKRAEIHRRLEEATKAAEAAAEAKRVQIELKEANAHARAAARAAAKAAAAAAKAAAESEDEEWHSAEDRSPEVMDSRVGRRSSLKKRESHGRAFDDNASSARPVRNTRPTRNSENLSLDRNSLADLLAPPGDVELAKALQRESYSAQRTLRSRIIGVDDATSPTPKPKARGRPARASLPSNLEKEDEAKPRGRRSSATDTVSNSLGIEKGSERTLDSRRNSAGNERRPMSDRKSSLLTEIFPNDAGRRPSRRSSMPEPQVNEGFTHGRKRPLRRASELPSVPDIIESERWRPKRVRSDLKKAEDNDDAAEDAYIPQQNGRMSRRSTLEKIPKYKPEDEAQAISTRLERRTSSSKTEHEPTRFNERRRRSAHFLILASPIPPMPKMDFDQTEGFMQLMESARK